MHGLQAPRRARSLSPQIYRRLLATAAAVALADQASKSWAVAELSDAPIDLGFVALRLTLNPGGAFGVFGGFPIAFTVATAAVVVVTLVWARKLTDTRIAWPVGLVIGGGVGNLLDRLLRDTGGGVVDFIDLGWWPVFNIADASIVVGVATILWLARGDRAPEP